MPSHNSASVFAGVLRVLLAKTLANNSQKSVFFVLRRAEKRLKFEKSALENEVSHAK